MKYRFVRGVVALMPLLFAVDEVSAYREGETEAEVEGDIERGEDKFVEKLGDAERNLLRETKQAFKAEEVRDLQILRGQKANEEKVNPPTTGEDSLAEIEREVDALPSR
jgi:hypothetical protein